jgi:hypothetical protein
MKRRRCCIFVFHVNLVRLLEYPALGRRLGLEEEGELCVSSVCATDPVFIYELLNIKHAENVATSNMLSIGPFCLFFYKWLYICGNSRAYDDKLSSEPGPKTLLKPPKNPELLVHFCQKIHKKWYIHR